MPPPAKPSAAKDKLPAAPSPDAHEPASVSHFRDLLYRGAIILLAVLWI
jgi:hypothetical protein